MSDATTIQSPVTNLVIDRPHRFSLGTWIRHTDDNVWIRVDALTWRLRSDGRLYPTYTIFVPSEGDTLDDILDTVDLVRIPDPDRY